MFGVACPASTSGEWRRKRLSARAASAITRASAPAVRDRSGSGRERENPSFEAPLDILVDGSLLAQQGLDPVDRVEQEIFGSLVHRFAPLLQKHEQSLRRCRQSLYPPILMATGFLDQLPENCDDRGEIERAGMGPVQEQALCPIEELLSRGTTRTARLN